ncbi:unnamed protein product [Paramecium pentaurelia]|uniref:Uncharacterized protein n=1 Tax=Paramecium pentaurelia TaxID=43138 RepID=A0A8S1UF67_9CILI|nr:unnamed protein product [Paramecium pentaurelia]
MASQKFMEFLSNNDKLRMNEMKLIEQEQYYISQLKDQREKMELLKIEFLKKDHVIQELQGHLDQLQQECEQLREIYQEHVQNQENEFHRLNKLQVEKDNLIKDNQELKDVIQHLRYENETLDSLQFKNDDQQRQLQQQLVILTDENSRLKQEIAKLDELLFTYEPLKDENEKLNEKLKYYKNEKQRLSSELKQGKLDINKQIDEFKQGYVKELKNEISRLQEYKDQYQTLKIQVQEFQQKYIEIIKENNDLKLEIKSLYEKEESEIKIKSEIDRVRQDLMSVRYQETLKLNELFNGMINLNSLVNSRDHFN